MESFQKRDRDRKKIERRNVKEQRRKERADRRRTESSPTSGTAAVVPPNDQGAAP